MNHNAASGSIELTMLTLHFPDRTIHVIRDVYQLSPHVAQILVEEVTSKMKDEDVRQHHLELSGRR